MPKDLSWYLCSIRAYNHKKAAVAQIDGSWKISRTESVALNPSERIVSARIDSNNGHPVQVTFVICDMDLMGMEVPQTKLPPISQSALSM